MSESTTVVPPSPVIVSDAIWLGAGRSAESRIVRSYAFQSPVLVTVIVYVIDVSSGAIWQVSASVAPFGPAWTWSHGAFVGAVYVTSLSVTIFGSWIVTVAVASTVLRSNTGLVGSGRLPGPYVSAAFHVMSAVLVSVAPAATAAASTGVAV